MPCGLKRSDACADARRVIELNRLHGNGTFYVNPDLIELVEACPDTTISLVNKHRYVVEDSVQVVVERIVEFRARIAAASNGSGDWSAGARIMPALASDEEQAA